MYCYFQLWKQKIDLYDILIKGEYMNSVTCSFGLGRGKYGNAKEEK